MSKEFEKSFDSVVNFTKSFKNSGDLIVNGCVMSNSLDLEGDSLTPSPNALKKAIPEFEKNGAIMLASHGKNPDYGFKKLGYWYNFKVTPENYSIDTPELPLVKMYASGIIQDNQAKVDTLNRKFNGSSVRVSALQLWQDAIGKSLITDLLIKEISICNIPMNQDCYFDSIKDTDSIADEFLYKVGQKVNAFGREAFVKSMLIGSDNSRKYVLDFADEYLKSVDVFEEDLIDYYKSYVTDFNDVSFENQLRNIIRNKVKNEGYYIPTQQLVNWKYDFTFPVRFGKNLEYSTEIKLDSSGKAQVLKKIKGADMKESVTDIVKGLDSDLGQTNYTMKIKKEKGLYTTEYFRAKGKEAKLDEVFKKYHETVNMSYSQLQEWSQNPKSKVASLDRSPIRRNLRLLSKKKEDWTQKDITDANRTISYVNRAKAIGKGKVTGKSEPFGRNEIALRNWAYKM
jgi:hypothetical protein